MSEKNASRSQLLGLAGMLAQHLPADLSAEIAQEWAEDPDSIKKLLATMKHGPNQIGQIKQRLLYIRIDPKRTIEEWVNAGKYNSYSLDITTANFGQFLTVHGTKPYETSVTAFCLGSNAKTEVVAHFRKLLGLKPTGFEHAAAVGEQYPNIQCKLGNIVNIDIVWEDQKRQRRVPYLNGVPNLNNNEHFRSFTLHVADWEWDQYTWFLGFEE